MCSLWLDFRRSTDSLNITYVIQQKVKSKAQNKVVPKNGGLRFKKYQLLLFIREEVLLDQKLLLR